MNKKIKTLKTNNGLKFCNFEFDNFYKQKMIMRHRIFKHTPQQNGMIKRINTNLINKVKRMLISSELAKGFRAEVMCIVAYLISKSPSSSVEFKTP